MPVLNSQSALCAAPPPFARTHAFGLCTLLAAHRALPASAVPGLPATAASLGTPWLSSVDDLPGSGSQLLHAASLLAACCWLLTHCWLPADGCCLGGCFLLCACFAERTCRGAAKTSLRLQSACVASRKSQTSAPLPLHLYPPHSCSSALLLRAPPSRFCSSV
jgi:hypothetical protein